MNPTRKHGKTPFSLQERNEIEAAHLLRRAGFGGTLQDVQAAGAQALATLVNQLVDYEQVPDTFTPPPDGILLDRHYSGDDLATWWLGRMISTPRPLQEKMTLFWHGHFATAVQKVGNTRWMYQQNQIFRQNALGRFDDLLSAVYKDPAMLRWLDGERNTKLAPNENWGREVMELFTVGIGNYTEDDVHASSRSFTGWRIDLNTNQGLFIDRLHDGGVKTLLGQTGNWDGEDAVRILAAHPATGTFLATRLWRFFASDQPPAGAIQTISDVYYTADHSIREMVRTLFSLPEFYSARVKSGHIKSPVEFVVGSIKQLGLSVTALDLKLLPRVLAGLGQELFNPPNVGGWPGGPTWINAATMLGRFNFASYLTGDQVRTKTPLIDTTAVLAASGAEMSDAFSATTRVETISTLASFVTDTLGIAPTVSTHRALIGYASEGSLALDALDTAIRGMIHLTLVSPEYQAS